jgi:hypothetical protein
MAGSPNLTNEHLLFGNLHVEPKFVVGDEVEILFQDLAGIRQAREYSQWLAFEQTASNHFRDILHSDLLVRHRPQDAIGEGEYPGDEDHDEEAPPRQLEASSVDGGQGERHADHQECKVPPVRPAGEY